MSTSSPDAHDHHAPEDKTHHHHDEERSIKFPEELYIRTPASAIKHHSHHPTQGKPIFHTHEEE